jgi:hypothetical protein
VTSVDMAGRSSKANEALLLRASGQNERANMRSTAEHTDASGWNVLVEASSLRSRAG